MNGVLDWLMQNRGTDPAVRQGLLAAGLGMMANQPSGGSPYPQQGGMLQSIGQGGLMGMSAYQDALYNQNMQAQRDAQLAQMEQENKRAQAQVEQAAREAEKARVEEERMMKYVASLPPEEQQQAEIMGKDYIKYKMKAAGGGNTEIDTLLDRAGIPRNSPEGIQAYQRALDIKTSRAPPMQTIIKLPPAVSKYDEVFAGEYAKTDIQAMKGAEDAPMLAEKANRVREVLASGKVFTGTGAEQLLAAQKLAKVAGFKVDTKAIVNTETVVRGLADQTLQQITGSGLGTGQGFTKTDLEFLEKARSGTITMDRGTLMNVTELAHRAAAKSMEKWNKRKREIGQSETTAARRIGVSMEPGTVPELYQSPKKGSGSPAQKPEWGVDGNGNPVRLK